MNSAGAAQLLELRQALKSGKQQLIKAFGAARPTITAAHTLLRSLARLDKAPAGEVQINGRSSVAFQEPRLLPWKTLRPIPAP